MARDYGEYAWHFRVLADAQHEGKLVFVLGAGVGRPYGLPDWSQLLADLLLQSGKLPRLETRLSSKKHIEETLTRERRAVLEILQRIAPDPLIQGAIARSSYPTKQWRAALRSQLSPPRRNARASDVLPRIGRMVVDSADARVDRHISVLTFNFDDLLEQEIRTILEQRGMDKMLMTTIHDEREFERTWLIPGIFVYHLHGFLGGPDHDQDKDSSEETVLDAASYVPVLSGDHWSWRCMDRALGTGHPSLFIGLSLADPSLRYVLTRWARWRAPINGVYLAPPPQLPDVRSADAEDSSIADYRTVALMYRSLMDLYSAVLDEMHLVCYHLTSWDEIAEILATVEEGV